MPLCCRTGGAVVAACIRGTRVRDSSSAQGTCPSFPLAWANWDMAQTSPLDTGVREMEATTAESGPGAAPGPPLCFLSPPSSRGIAQSKSKGG